MTWCMLIFVQIRSFIVLVMLHKLKLNINHNNEQYIVTLLCVGTFVTLRPKIKAFEIIEQNISKNVVINVTYDVVTFFPL